MCTCFHCPVRVHILPGACLLARDDARPTSYSAEDQAGVFYTTRASIGTVATTCCSVCNVVLGRACATVRLSTSQPVALRHAPLAIAKRRCSSTMSVYLLLHCTCKHTSESKVATEQRPPPSHDFDIARTIFLAH